MESEIERAETSSSVIGREDDKHLFDEGGTSKQGDISLFPIKLYMLRVVGDGIESCELALAMAAGTSSAEFTS